MQVNPFALEYRSHMSQVWRLLTGRNVLRGIGRFTKQPMQTSCLHTLHILHGHWLVVVPIFGSSLFCKATAARFEELNFLGRILRAAAKHPSESSPSGCRGACELLKEVMGHIRAKYL